MNLHTFFYNDVIIADHLKLTYNFEPWQISLIQAVQPFGFLLTTHFTPKIIPKFKPFLIIITA